MVESECYHSKGHDFTFQGLLKWLHKSLKVHFPHGLYYIITTYCFALVLHCEIVGAKQGPMRHLRLACENKERSDICQMFYF